jgi:hypothetical protein
MQSGSADHIKEEVFYLGLPSVLVFAGAFRFSALIPRPGQTLVGTPNVPMFGYDMPLIETITSITLINM